MSNLRRRTVAKLRRTQNTVNLILLNHPAARVSDDILYMLVCESYEAGITNMPAWRFFVRRAGLRLPSYESVSRSRRKAQEKYPEFSDNIDVKEARDDLDIVYAQVFKRGK